MQLCRLHCRAPSGFFVIPVTRTDRLSRLPCLPRRAPVLPRAGLPLEQLRPALLELDEHQRGDDREPVEHVGEHAAHGRVVRPPKDRVEDRPALPDELRLGVPEGQVPHVPAHVVRARAVGALVVDVLAQEGVVAVK